MNLFGAPGSGKSTLAAGLFHCMKREGLSVELVTEFAKELVWENRKDTLAIQPYVNAKQYRNLFRMKGKVDYVVTDSPLLVGRVYARLYSSLPEEYYTLLDWYHETLSPSVNLLLEAPTEYKQEGRTQTEEEAREIGVMFSELLDYDIRLKDHPDLETLSKEIVNVRHTT